MLAIALVVIGVLSRGIVHLPNFTPVIAIALFSGMYLSKKQSLTVPVILFVISDLFVGLHSLVLFTWGGVVLIALLGRYFRNRASVKNIVCASLMSAVIFFVVSNFGVWLVVNAYPKTIFGLMECYAMGIPYFKNTLISTGLYTLVIFGGYNYLVLRLRNTRFEYVL